MPTFTISSSFLNRKLPDRVVREWGLEEYGVYNERICYTMRLRTLRDVLKFTQAVGIVKFFPTDVMDHARIEVTVLPPLE